MGYQQLVSKRQLSGCEKGFATVISDLYLPPPAQAQAQPAQAQAHAQLWPPPPPPELRYVVGGGGGLVLLVTPEVKAVISPTTLPAKD